ncbi:Uncharacterised protein [Chlamydia trachomatis]|nr:Uncharacterised protein [Chlamydia trachomatis]
MHLQFTETLENAIYLRKPYSVALRNGFLIPAEWIPYTSGMDSVY